MYTVDIKTSGLYHTITAQIISQVCYRYNLTKKKLHTSHVYTTTNMVRIGEAVPPLPEITFVNAARAQLKLEMSPS